MTSAEDWDSTVDDPYRLFQMLQVCSKADQVHLSEGKLRLMCVNFTRAHEYHNHPTWKEAVEAIENVVDGKPSSYGLPCRNTFELIKQHLGSTWGWLWASLQNDIESAIYRTFDYDCGFTKYWSSHPAAGIMHDMFGNPFKPVTLPVCDVCAGDYTMRWIDSPDTGRCNSCIGGSKVRNKQVLALALKAYNNRRANGKLDQDSLLVLSDAMEEYGCNVEPCNNCQGTGQVTVCSAMLYSCGELGCMDECTHKRQVSCSKCGGHGVVPHPMVAHLRRRGFSHYRGCWVIDQLLTRKG